MQWLLKTFDDLTPHQLYALLRLRAEVFVVEQTCAFQDLDNKDQCSHHLLGFMDGQLMAYTRLVPPGEIYAEPSIGRVVTSPLARGTGAGRELMQRSIETTHELFGVQPIKIGAQLYLQRFYESLGFERVSDVYLEDNIEHIYMIRR